MVSLINHVKPPSLDKEIGILISLLEPLLAIRTLINSSLVRPQELIGQISIALMSCSMYGIHSNQDLDVSYCEYYRNIIIDTRIWDCNII